MSNLGGTSTSLGASSDETDLMRRARDGDRGAFGQIVLLYQDRLYNAILRIVGDSDEAKSLSQETFARTLAKIETFRGESKPYTWIFRIGVNLAISHLRKVKRQRTFSLHATSNENGDSHDDQASSLAGRVADEKNLAPDAAAVQREAQQQILAALGRLDAEYRAVIIMRDVEGFDYEQMAQVLNVPLGTLKSRLFRARLALRDEMRAYMG